MRQGPPWWRLLGGTLAWAGFLAVTLGPLLALAPHLGASPPAPGTAEGADGLLNARRLGLLGQSMAYALAVAAGAVALGLLGATALRGSRGRGAGLGRRVPLALLLVPPYVHALVWMAFAARLSPLLESHGLPPIPLSGWLAAWWVQLMALAPAALGLAWLGLEAVDPALVEAAAVQAPGEVVWRRVLLPLALPYLAAAAALIGLLTLAEFSVPSLFSVNVYALELFAEFSATGSAGQALLLALPLLAVTAAVVLLSQSALRSAAAGGASRSRRVRPLAYAGGFRALQVGALDLMGAVLLAVIATLVVGVGSATNLVASVQGAAGELGYSATVAAAAGLLAALLAWPVAARLVRGRRPALGWLVVSLPLVVPAPLVGVGLAALGRWPLWAGVGSGWLPVAAGLARFTPVAVLVLVAALRRYDPAWTEAARVSGAGPARAWWRVQAPLLAPAALAAAAVVFALTATELGATLLVAPPGRQTVTLHIYNYLHYGASEQVAGLCLLMVAVALAAGWLVGRKQA